MTQPSESTVSTQNPFIRLAELSQLEFELEFFAGILARHTDYLDLLRAHGHNLTMSGRYHQGLEIDQQLIRLRPHDPVAHYNLACSYALLEKGDKALIALRQAIELGYRDFRYLREDRDLETIRKDPRFRQLLCEFENV